MNPHLLNHLKTAGFQALKSQRKEFAIQCFKKILELQPDFENGAISYELACLYEEANQESLAKKYYLRALNYQPDNQTFLEKYASFLYLYDDLNEAFDLYLKLNRMQKSSGNKNPQIISTIKILGEKLLFDEKEIDLMLEKS